MSKRTRNILIVIAVLLLVGAVVLWLLSRGEEPAPTETPTNDTPTTTNGLSASTDVTAPAPNPLFPDLEPVVSEGGDQRLLARQSAEIFAERYGSWSNQESFANLRDVLPTMTPSFRAETQAYLDAQGVTPPAEVYEGVTSTKLSSTLDSFDDTSATVRVRMQREKTDSNGTTVVYEDLILDLESAGGNWLVDSAEWIQ